MHAGLRVQGAGLRISGFEVEIFRQRALAFRVQRIHQVKSSLIRSYLGLCRGLRPAGDRIRPHDHSRKGGQGVGLELFGLLLKLLAHLPPPFSVPTSVLHVGLRVQV